VGLTSAGRAQAVKLRTRIEWYGGRRSTAAQSYVVWLHRNRLPEPPSAPGKRVPEKCSANVRRITPTLPGPIPSSGPSRVKERLPINTEPYPDHLRPRLQLGFLTPPDMDARHHDPHTAYVDVPQARKEGVQAGCYSYDGLDKAPMDA
jgi:hypothetical protein